MARAIADHQRGTVVHLGPCPEQVAADIVDRVGLLAAARIAIELIAAITGAKR